MNLDDKLTAENRKARSEAEKAGRYYADEPDWMIYKDREKPSWLNKDKGVFEETDKNAINKAPSVFERTTLFNTGE